MADEPKKGWFQRLADGLTRSSKQMTDLALLNLYEADTQAEAGAALFELADKLLKRQQ